MKKRNGNKLIAAGIITSLLASLCCITPLLVMLAGLGGLASSFSWIEPLRPYLIALTVLVLGFAWYGQLKNKKNKDIECDCENEEKPGFTQSRLFLGIVTVFAVLMIAFPYYSDIFYGGRATQTEMSKNGDIINLNLKVNDMTCESCALSIQQAITELPGLIDSEMDYEKEEAYIKINKKKLSVQNLIEVINQTGYKVRKYTIINY